MIEYIKDLETKITEGMSLKEIVGVFEQMSQEPIEEEMFLFETGTFDFTGEEMFYFSMVRQFPNEEDEYYQIHVNVLYEPSEKTSQFLTMVWDEDLDENFFDYIRTSEAFEAVKDDKYVDVEIYMDET
ncbi:MAG TPA: hypothetical protein IAA26_06530 [Candidatus Blautia faecipullorum]|nr:hypothetical protein [Candidatus Blautia faecipullorum]